MKISSFKSIENAFIVSFSFNTSLISKMALLTVLKTHTSHYIHSYPIIFESYCILPKETMEQDL